MAFPLMRRRGPGNAAFVDGIADRRVGRTRALGPHIALGGESRHQVVARRQRRRDRALRDGLLHGLQIFRAGMEKKMDMGVDQSGQECAIAQVDDFGAGGMLDRCAHLDDALALDENFAWLDRCARS